MSPLQEAFNILFVSFSVVNTPTEKCKSVKKKINDVNTGIDIYDV